MARLPRFSLAGLRRVEFLVVAALVGFVAVLVALSIYAGLDQVLAHLGSVGARVLLLMLGLSLVNYLLRAWRWQHFSLGLGLRVAWPRNFLYFVAGFALTATPGKAGEGLRMWLLERCHGYAYERSAPLFVGDRLNDMAAILLLCLAGVGAFTAYAEITVLAAALMLVACLPLMRPKILLRATNIAFGLFGRRAPRLFARIRTAIRETARLFTFRLFGLGLLAALIGWFAEITAFHQLLAQLGAPVTLQQAMFVFTFAMIAGTVAMLPGGLGGTEAVMLALLGALGVDFQAAIAATAVIRLTTLWFAVGLGFAALPVSLRLARRGPARAAVLEPAR
jgi:glycosyltransferase 2 family protein